MIFFEKNKGKYLTASTVQKELNLLEGHKDFFPHGLLIELKKQGQLEKDKEEKRKVLRNKNKKEIL